jgi:hypothetical protein
MLNYYRIFYFELIHQFILAEMASDVSSLIFLPFEFRLVGSLRDRMQVRTFLFAGLSVI